MREEVLKFAQQMDRKLTENSHKGYQGWKTESQQFLLDKLDEEISEVKDAILTLTLDPDAEAEVSEEYKEQLTREAADAANVLMMLADNLGNLSSK